VTSSRAPWPGRAWTCELTWGLGPNGASQSLDVLLVLDTLDDEMRDDAEARHVSQRVRADWIAFATTGDPGWAPYDVTSRSTRVYDAEPATRPHPEEASRHIWRRHAFDVLDLPGQTA
jgi:para-nitrobenzyl esterase